MHAWLYYRYRLPKCMDTDPDGNIVSDGLLLMNGFRWYWIFLQGDLLGS